MTRDSAPTSLRADVLLVSLLVLESLVALRPFVLRFIYSDFLALAVTIHDDSFYYLVPAFNFKEHWRYTFDGLHATYGFQPLYMLILTALSLFSPSAEIVLRFGLCLNALLHASTAVILGLIINATLPHVLRPIRYFAALSGTVLYLLGYELFFANVVLKENPLASFLYALASLLTISLISRPHQQRPFVELYLGGLLGSLILTRILPASFLAVFVILITISLTLPRRSLLRVATALAVPLLLWGVYAETTLGHLLPTSALVKGEGILGFLRHWTLLPTADIVYAFRRYISGTLRFLCDLHQPGPLTPLRVALLLAGFLALLTSLLVKSWWTRERILQAGLAAASLSGLLAIPTLLYTRQAELLYYTWYVFDVPVVCIAMFATAFGFFLQRLADGPLKRVPSRLPVGPLLVGVLFLTSSAAVHWTFRHVNVLAEWRYSATEWQHVMARTTLWFRSTVTLGRDERVGAFNAGLVGLLLPGKVINLDGLANDDIVEHLRKGGRLADYVRRRRIRYVIDVLPPAYWEKAGISTEVMKIEEFKDRMFPAYYVLRVLP